MRLPVTWTHFERWLSLFHETAHETCPPAGAAHVIERAEQIAQSLHLAVQEATRSPGEVPSCAEMTPYQGDPKRLLPPMRPAAVVSRRPARQGEPIALVLTNADL